MNAFDTAFQNTVDLEGDYSNNLDDKGGPTMYGITQAIAQEYGYMGPMDQLPLVTAKMIYKAEYWNKLNLDAIAKTSMAVSVKLFDIGVNMGIEDAGMFLQRALNCLTYSPPLKLDGIIGSQTLQRFQDSNVVLVECILKMINAQQCMHYIAIVEADPSQKIFLKGWISNRVSV